MVTLPPSPYFCFDALTTIMFYLLFYLLFSINQNEGVLALYKGIQAAWLRESLYTSVKIGEMFNNWNAIEVRILLSYGQVALMYPSICLSVQVSGTHLLTWVSEYSTHI